VSYLFSECAFSVIDFEHRAVFGPGLAVIVDAGNSDIGMAESLPGLGDVGLMIERIAGSRRAQRMGADCEARRRRIAPHEPAGTVVADRAEQRAVVVRALR
jgi:hypothetical protein